jgi:serine/threonine protein kinase
MQSYYKINKLGSGTYGKVYEAVNDYDERVAIKRNLIPPEFNYTIASIRELDILNLIKNHPYCIKLKDVVFDLPFNEGGLSPLHDNDRVDDRAFFVMEKGDCDGEDFIRRNYSFREKILFVVNILLAIEFLHSRGIYHRDVKPANIICFLEDNKLLAAKINDFGHSQFYSIQSLSSARFVTIWYRAPEICLHKNYDYKSDIWSVGCIIFETFSLNNRKFTKFSSPSQVLDYLINIIKFESSDIELAACIYPGKINPPFTAGTESINNRSIRTQMGYPDKYDVNNYEDLYDLLNNILVANTENRFSASQCLNHIFFKDFRHLINRTRGLFGITREGTWILKPETTLLYNNSDNRIIGMSHFCTIYNNRASKPISKWFSHRIFTHAVFMFDRFLIVEEDTNGRIAIPKILPDGNVGLNYASSEDLKLVVNTILFISSKYFRILVNDYGPEHFYVDCPEIDSETFLNNVSTVEDFIIRKTFSFSIYRETFLEANPEFISENDLEKIYTGLFNGSIPSGIILSKIHKYVTSEQQQLNLPSPL